MQLVPMKNIPGFQHPVPGAGPRGEGKRNWPHQDGNTRQLGVFTPVLAGFLRGCWKGSPNKSIEIIFGAFLTALNALAAISITKWL